MAGWYSVSERELCFQQQNDKDVVLNNEEQRFLFYKTSLSASVVLFMNNTLCICIMRQCLIEWLHNMLFHRIKYEIFIRPERELECLVVKSLTREIQLLLLAPSEYVSSLSKKALKATRNFIPKYTIPSWLMYYPNRQEYALSGAWRDTVKRRSPTSFHVVKVVRCFTH